MGRTIKWKTFTIIDKTCLLLISQSQVLAKFCIEGLGTRETLYFTDINVLFHLIVQLTDE